MSGSVRPAERSAHRGSPRLVAAARRAGVRDPRVLAALLEVPRASYVPPERAGDADRDEPVPIPHDQVTSQPSLIAAMIEALRLTGDEKVLEVGTGYGFQTALLARLARSVWSVEWFEDLADVARANLAREGVRNATVRAGDGTEGLPAEAPFDAIVVSASFPAVPPPLVDQLVTWRPPRAADRERRPRRRDPLRAGGRRPSPPGHRHAGPLRAAARPARIRRPAGQGGSAVSGGDRLLTSESVTEGHPDKVADQISDAVLDALLAQDAGARVACDALVAHGLVVVAGEITSEARVDVVEIVRRTLLEVGYTAQELGLEPGGCPVLTAITGQSPEIAGGIARSTDVSAADGRDRRAAQGAGDQGLMIGYATDETPELMPLPIMVAHAICRRLAEVRRRGQLGLGSDGKCQVTVRYAGGRPVAVEAIVVSVQHRLSVPVAQVRDEIPRRVVRPVLEEAGLWREDIPTYVNPAGSFHVGGRSHCANPRELTGVRHFRRRRLPAVRRPPGRAGPASPARRPRSFVSSIGASRQEQRPVGERGLIPHAFTDGTCSRGWDATVAAAGRYGRAASPSNGGSGDRWQFPWGPSGPPPRFTEGAEHGKPTGEPPAALRSAASWRRPVLTGCRRGARPGARLQCMSTLQHRPELTGDRRG